VASDGIDHRVGLSQLLGKGAEVAAGGALCLIHAADEASFAQAASRVKNAYVLSGAPGESATILARIAA
jgi:thymidine phosphorylase